MFLEEKCYEMMCAGTVFIKMRGTARKYKRTFRLSPDHALITWSPSLKKIPTLEVNTISNVYCNNEKQLVIESNTETFTLLGRNPNDVLMWMIGIKYLILEKVSHVRERKFLEAFDKYAGPCGILHADQASEVAKSLTPFAKYISFPNVVIGPQFYSLLQPPRPLWAVFWCQTDFDDIDSFAHSLFFIQSPPVCHEMSGKLSDYFINAAHNSYMTGDQILGTTTPSHAANLAAKGVRYLELDVWDGQDGNPVVTHGYTLVNSVPLSEILKAINEQAFISSAFPLIIALENHCGIRQQRYIASSLHAIFGNRLFIPGFNRPDIASLRLTALCGKVIIQGKRLPLQDLESGEVSDENSADELPKEFKLEPGNTISSHEERLTPYEQRRKQQTLSGQRPTVLLCKPLSSISALRSRALFPGLISRSLNTEESCVYSVAENEAVRLVRERYKDFSLFCDTHLVKVSPSPSRVDSSNPADLVQFWRCGIQMVALNHQTDDRSLRLSQALFAANGNCGYYRKPQQSGPSLDFTIHVASVTAVMGGKWTLHIELLGHPKDVATHYLDRPSKVSFHVTDSSFAFLRMAVYQQPIGAAREFLSDIFIPVNTMQEGVRLLQLSGSVPVALLVDISISQVSVASAKPRRSLSLLHRRRLPSDDSGLGSTSSSTNVSPAKYNLPVKQHSFNNGSRNHFLYSTNSATTAKVDVQSNTFDRFLWAADVVQPPFTTTDTLDSSGMVSVPGSDGSFIKAYVSRHLSNPNNVPTPQCTMSSFASQSISIDADWSYADDTFTSEQFAIL